MAIVITHRIDWGPSVKLLMLVFTHWVLDRSEVMGFVTRFGTYLTASYLMTVREIGRNRDVPVDGRESFHPATNDTPERR